MKNMSLWTTAIVSALFVVMVCIDNHSWKLLSVYAAVLAVWMLVGWFWHHRFDLEHDLKTLSKAESPMKCRWIGTLVFMAFVLMVVIALFIWGLYALGMNALNQN